MATSSDKRAEGDSIVQAERLALPSLDGVTFRYFEGPADYERLAPVFTTSAAVDKIEAAVTPQMLEHWYTTTPGFDVDRDLFIVETGDEIASYSTMMWWDEVEGDRIYAHYSMVMPEWRDRGLQPMMLHTAERRLEELARAHADGEQPPRGQLVLEATANDMDPGRHALLGSEGYIAVRYQFRMVRPNLDDIPDLLLPEGIETRPVTPDQYHRIWESSNDGFADHWGMFAPSEEEYQSWMTSDFFQPDVWQVAWEGEEAVGSVLGFINHESNRVYNRARGLTESISVRKPWRRRGIARALLARSLKKLRDMGMTEAGLTVDTQNPNGALQLYESMGFLVVTTRTIYRKPLVLSVPKG